LTWQSQLSTPATHCSGPHPLEEKVGKTNEIKRVSPTIRADHENGPGVGAGPPTDGVDDNDGKRVPNPIAQGSGMGKEKSGGNCVVQKNFHVANDDLTGITPGSFFVAKTRFS